MPTAEDIAAIRSDYRMATLDEEHVGEDPLGFFSHWFSEAQTAQISEVNAMTLATVDQSGKPHARIILLKGLDDNGFVFFTNYQSAKGSDLLGNPNAALVFFWKELERQVRIEGVASRVADHESDAYFASRPPGSRIGAWASPQSQIIPSRDILESRAFDAEQRFNNGDIPRPDYWGGYRIIPQQIEFWQGRSNRLHDRIRFVRESPGLWRKERLAP